MWKKRIFKSDLAKYHKVSVPWYLTMKQVKRLCEKDCCCFIAKQYLHRCGSKLDSETSTVFNFSINVLFPGRRCTLAFSPSCHSQLWRWVCEPPVESLQGDGATCSISFLLGLLFVSAVVTNPACVLSAIMTNHGWELGEGGPSFSKHFGGGSR